MSAMFGMVLGAVMAMRDYFAQLWRVTLSPSRHAAIWHGYSPKRLSPFVDVSSVMVDIANNSEYCAAVDIARW